MINGNYKISFCVVCMNRLHQLKQTLLQNIQDNEDYNELEFIVLDYNSKDGMQEWVKDNMGEYISNGRLIYYKTNDPESWSPSHSKNLAFKLATGDIVCSIWADYYTGKGFAKYVNEMFNADSNIVLTPIDFHKTQKKYNPPGDVLGKVCVKREDFIKIKGFDERMNKHGFEDYDFINRLEMIGVKRILIEDFAFLKYISHDDAERFLLPTDNLKGFYVNYLTPSMSEVIFLYNDETFDKATVIDNYTIEAYKYEYAYMPKTARFEYELKQGTWENGCWENLNENSIHFKSPAGINFTCKIDTVNLITDSGQIFYNIKDKEVINGILVFKHFYFTRRIMEENLKNNTAIVNLNTFGEASVFKNLQCNESISS
ncbi:MAG: glycosyltransferase [Mucilaginibacter sp.]